MIDNINTNIDNRSSVLNINTNNINNNNKDSPTQLPIDLNIEHLHNDDINNILNNRTLTFTTHNVHSLNNNLKNKQILETFMNQKIDFVGLTETHHKPHHELNCNHQEFYDTYWSNNFNKFTGVGFLVHKNGRNIYIK